MKFHATEDGSLIYSLKPTGKYKKGEELMENDVCVRIEPHPWRALIANVIIKSLEEFTKKPSE